MTPQRPIKQSNIFSSEKRKKKEKEKEKKRKAKKVVKHFEERTRDAYWNVL